MTRRPRLEGRRILVVTPSPTGPRGGNVGTARRYAGYLRQLGAEASVRPEWSGERPDACILLHARRSAPSIAALHEAHPEIPKAVVLTGTDLYHDLGRSSVARRSLTMADRIIVLQALGPRRLPKPEREKARVIIQSVTGRMPPWDPVKRRFRVCVVGHLRPVKDPFRAALASRRVPPTSRLEVVQIGGAVTPAMAERAEAEQARNPRYRWTGELPRSRVYAAMSRSHLVLVTSKMEGGSNAVCEALAGGYPAATSAIDGSLGLLGEDHPAVYPVGDTAALATLLQRLETEPAALRALRQRSRALSPLVRPARERAALKGLVSELLLLA